MASISSINTVDIHQIGKLLEIASKDTLIISDITNTLYKPCNTMSDKKWRTYLAGRVRATIADETQASKTANSLENLIVNQVDKQLVHANAPAVIAELQAKGIPLIAISLKNWSAPYDPNFGTTTSNHLRKLGIHLEESVPLLGKMKTTEEYTFAKGIIFTNKKPLDKALDTFLGKLEKKPKHIIILENSVEHKDQLTAVIKAHQIAVTFVQHKNAASKEEDFDPILGTIEFLQFMQNSKVVLDEEAKKIKAETASFDYEAALTAYIKSASNL